MSVRVGHGCHVSPFSIEPVEPPAEVAALVATPSLPAPTAARGASCCFLSKQEDVMGGCERCGRVSGVLASHSSRVRGGSVTMGFLANTVSPLCCGGNRLVEAGAAQGLEWVLYVVEVSMPTAALYGHNASQDTVGALRGCCKIFHHASVHLFNTTPSCTFLLQCEEGVNHISSLLHRCFCTEHTEVVEVYSCFLQFLFKMMPLESSFTPALLFTFYTTPPL